MELCTKWQMLRRFFETLHPKNKFYSSCNDCWWYDGGAGPEFEGPFCEEHVQVSREQRQCFFDLGLRFKIKYIFVTTACFGDGNTKQSSA